MFAKPPQDKETSELFPTRELTPPENQEKLIQPSPEIVTIVEKISSILSPYFIVLVGLFLYRSNVFLGTILIAVGILSLLNISWKDMTTLWEKIQKRLNSNETDFLP